MPVLIAVILALSMLGFVLYPLYRGRLEHVSEGPVEQTPAQSEDGNQGSEREQAARTALQEVELDYQLGNITEDDYRTLRERYVRQALVALKARHEREQELDVMIEEQLRTMKESHENVDS